MQSINRAFSAIIILFIGAFLLGSALVNTLAAQQTTTHTVQIGETLDSIAAIYGVSAEELATVNGLATDAVLFAGQQLIIPRPPETDATPRGSTAGDVTTNVDVQDAGPTAIPITPTPTPLPYDPNRIVSVIDPDPNRSFVVNIDPIHVRGVVQFDSATMEFWKIEIRGFSRRSRIWQNDDPMQSVPAFDWVTIDTRTDPVIDGYLGTIPAFPTIDRGRWEMRVVAVNVSGDFVDQVVVPFRVVPEFEAVTASITSPAPGEVLQAGDPINGILMLNWAISTYRVELIGGNYYSWQTIAHVPNDPANPILIDQTPIATLPEDLIPGIYRVRLIVNGPDANYIQDPYEVEFAVGTTEVNNLSQINFTEPRSLVNRNRIRANANVPIVGTVTIPDPNGHFKVEIKDADNLLADQSPRFPDWTTLGDMQTESVVNGVIGEAPGIYTLPEGNYLMRVVVVDSDGQFSAEREFELRIIR